MHIELWVLFNLHACLLDSRDALAVTIASSTLAGRAAWGRKDNLNLYPVLGGIDEILFDLAILHFFGFNGECFVGYIDETCEGITRIVWADDQIRVGILCVGMAPVCIEDCDDGL